MEHQKKVEDKLRLDFASQRYQFEALTDDKNYQVRPPHGIVSWRRRGTHPAPRIPHPAPRNLTAP